ncbi:MucBP domain-containing protein, partial [Streptococcus sp. ZJ93]|uniref:MucBP domain-containing protein n=1 Tax=Streptococcus handemini TaxID=3161188 RepID=UPI0032ECC099
MFQRKKDRFSIRKFKVGVGSVFLGSVLLGAPNVYADETATIHPETEAVAPVTENPNSATSATTENASSVVSETVEDKAKEESAITADKVYETAIVPTEAKEELAKPEEVSAGTDEEAKPASEDPSITDLSARKATIVSIISTYQNLSNELKESFITRVNESTDVADLKEIANEARRANRPKAPTREEAFPNQGKPFNNLGTSDFRVIDGDTTQPNLGDTPSGNEGNTSQNEKDAVAYKDYYVKDTSDPAYKDPSENRYTFANIVHDNVNANSVAYALSVDASGPTTPGKKTPDKVYITAFNHQTKKVLATKELELTNANKLNFGFHVQDPATKEMIADPNGLNLDSQGGLFIIASDAVSFIARIAAPNTNQAHQTSAMLTYTGGKNVASPISVNEPIASIPIWYPQFTKYYDEATGKEIHDSYVQYGWSGMSYHTVPVEIEGYTLVSSSSNTAGSVGNPNTFKKGDFQYNRQTVTPTNGATKRVTIYTKTEYLDDEGTTRVTTYFSPKDADTEDLPTAESFFFSIMTDEERAERKQANKKVLAGAESTLARLNAKQNLSEGEEEEKELTEAARDRAKTRLAALEGGANIQPRLENTKVFNWAKYVAVDGSQNIPADSDLISSDVDAFYAGHVRVDGNKLVENFSITTNLVGTSKPGEAVRVQFPFAQNSTVGVGGINIRNRWSGDSNVVYEYREIKTGDVILHYVDTEGNILQPNHHNTDDKRTGSTYTVTDDEKLEKITRTEPGEDGKPRKVTYILKEQSTNAEGKVHDKAIVENISDTNTIVTDTTGTGKVKEGKQNIIYVYEKSGSVIVNYVDEAGNPLRFKKGDEIVEGDQKVVTDGKANTPYNT